MAKGLEPVPLREVSILIPLTLKALGNCLSMIREKQFSGLILQTLLLSQIRLWQLLVELTQTTMASSGFVSNIVVLDSTPTVIDWNVHRPVYSSKGEYQLWKDQGLLYQSMYKYRCVD